MKICVNIATSSDCVNLNLGACSLISFGVGCLMVARFYVPFKCTVDKKLQTLITPYTNVLCNRNKHHSISLFEYFQMANFPQHFFSGLEPLAFDETTTSPKLCKKANAHLERSRMALVSVS